MTKCNIFTTEGEWQKDKLWVIHGNGFAGVIKEIPLTDRMSKLWHFPSFWDQICPAEWVDWTAHVAFFLNLSPPLWASWFDLHFMWPLCACKHSLQYKSGFGYGQMVEHFSVYVHIRALNLVYVSKLVWFEIMCVCVSKHVQGAFATVV